VLLALNESGQLQDRLTLIYPEDGIITADYPLMLLNQAKRSDYDRLVTYLRSPEFQSEMMSRTLRRPAIPGVRLDGRIPDTLLVELPFPNTLEVIDALLFSYLDRQRVPSHAFFVLDVSGSMAGKGLAGLKQALDGLTGLDTSLTGRFSRFRGRERVSMLTFNDELQLRRDFRIDDPAAEAAGMQEIRDYTAGLEAGGGTAIYSALAQTLRDAFVAREQEPNRYYSIVLMSDGESNRGMSEQEFRRYFDGLPAEAKDVRVFTVVFGKADRNAMDRIAELTGGRSFDGTRDPLDVIFKQIRGYQ
jgi:Ca-activated chloride channel homolog